MLKEKDLPAFIYGDLKREELIRTGSVVLHEKYFAKEPLINSANIV